MKKQTDNAHALAITADYLHAYKRQELTQRDMSEHVKEMSAMWRTEWEDKDKKNKAGTKKIEPYCKGIKIKLPKGEYKSYYDFIADGKEQEYEIIESNRIIGSVAIIDITDFITRKGYYAYAEYWDWQRWHYLGTEDIRELLKMLGKDPRIKAVVLNVSSGGGMVDGTESLANDVYDFVRLYKKKIYATVQGCAMSAAYWIVSGADYIYLSEKTTKVGSIGTMVSLIDDSVFLKQIGYRIININAPLSTQKNAAYKSALAGNTQMMEQQLAQMNNVFVDGVLKGRRKKIGIPAEIKAENLNVDNAPLQLMGKEYIGAGAILAGLADDIKTLDETIDLAAKKSATEVEQPIINSPIILRVSTSNTQSNEESAAIRQEITANNQQTNNKPEVKTGHLELIPLIIIN